MAKLGWQAELSSSEECCARSFFPIPGRGMPWATSPQCNPFTLTHPPWGLFPDNVFLCSVQQRSSISKQNSLQTGSSLSHSCGGEARVPLWLQSSEDMEQCSKGRVTRSLCCCLPRLWGYTVPVFTPQVNHLLLTSSPALACIPLHISLIQSALRDTFLTEFHVFTRACIQPGDPNDPLTGLTGSPSDSDDTSVWVAWS